MPIYEYECGACGERHEFIQKFSDGLKRKCPSCGKLRLKKQISAAAFHLKGDGWYVTDFRDKGKGGKGKEKPDSVEGSGDSKPDSKSTDSKSTDSKPSDSKATGSKAADSKATGSSGDSSRTA